MDKNDLKKYGITGVKEIVYNPSYDELFPRVTIYYLQITGKYKPLAPAGPSVDVSVEDDPEPAPEPEAEPRDEGGET